MMIDGDRHSARHEEQGAGLGSEVDHQPDVHFIG